MQSERCDTVSDSSPSEGSEDPAQANRLLEILAINNCFNTIKYFFRLDYLRHYTAFPADRVTSQRAPFQALSLRLFRRFSGRISTYCPSPEPIGRDGSRIHSLQEPT